MQNSITKAVMYARVSTYGQAQDSDSLTNQLIRCQGYADEHGLEVVNAFHEHASGRSGNRVELQNAYDFCVEQNEPMYLLVKDSSRFMRSLDEQQSWKDKFYAIGVQIRDVESNCISYVSKEEDPDAYLKEKRASLDAEDYTLQNAKKVKAGMLARLEQGGWPYNPPVGYMSERINGASNVYPHRVNAPIVKEMLGRLASGELYTLKDAEDFLLTQGFVNGYGKPSKSSHDRIRNILKRLSFYAGDIEHDSLKGRTVKGLHEPLIDKATYHKLKDRMQELKRNPQRNKKKCDLDFPLLGHLYCDHCGQRMYNTPSSSKGRTYNYYLCRNKDCMRKGKNVSAKKMEQAVCNYLKQLSCTAEMNGFIQQILKEQLGERLVSARKSNSKLEHTIRKREETKGAMLERLAQVSPLLSESMETQILKVDAEINRYKSRRQLEGLTAKQSQIIEAKASLFFDSLDSYWESASTEGKKIIIHGVLGGKINFHATKGISQATSNTLFTSKEQ